MGDAWIEGPPTMPGLNWIKREGGEGFSARCGVMLVVYHPRGPGMRGRPCVEYVHAGPDDGEPDYDVVARITHHIPVDVPRPPAPEETDR